MLRNLGQIRGVVSTFAKQSMAIDAVVLVPYVLAMSHFRRDVLGMGQFGKLPVTVHRQYQKNQCRYCGGCYSEYT